MTSTPSLQSLSLDRFISVYGVIGAFVTGLLSEHEYLFTAQGGVVRTLANGNRVALVPAASGRSFDTFPIVCSELVQDFTEDGPVVVRCGGRVHGSDFGCPGHQEEIDSFRSMSEVDRWAAERQDEGVAY